MRVRAKADFRNLSIEGRLHQGISPLEDYFVIEVSPDSYRVVDDQGDPILYPKELFEVVDRRIPAEWQFAEYADGEYHLEPVRTGIAGFYEDFFCSDGDRAAQLRTQRILREVIEAALKGGDDEDARLIRRDLETLPRRD